MLIINGMEKLKDREFFEGELDSLQYMIVDTNLLN